MKIIGKTAEGFILEATRDEILCIANLYQRSARERRDLIAEGNIPVADIYADAVALLDTHQNALDAARALSAAAKNFIAHFKRSDA